MDGLTAWIFNGTLVKVSSSVFLGLSGGGELHDDHFKKSLSSVDPLLANDFHKILKTTLSLLASQCDLELLEHLPDSVKVSIHNIADKSDNWLHNKLNEAARKFGTGTIIGDRSKLLFLRVEVVITPELFHELDERNLEFLSIDTGKASQSKGPAEKGRTEGDGTVGRVDLLTLAHIIALVGRDDDVCVLNDTKEVLIHSLTIDLELEDTTINLVDEEDGLNLFTKSLTKNSLSLDTNAFDVIDDDECTVSDTEGSGNF